MQTLKQRVAQVLLDIEAVGFSPEKPVTFKSGIISPVYVDNRRLPFFPQAWRTVIEGFAAQITYDRIACDIIAGVAVGGVPHSAALAYALGLPSVFVRPQPKEHGTQRQVEGGDITNTAVLLVEDLVTTGGSSLQGVRALRSAGGIVNDVLAIVSYGMKESAQTFGEAGVTLHTLTDFTTILDEAMVLGQFDETARAVIDDWFRDPHGWARRQGL